MPDGSTWDVPAKIIAENRAKYYAEKDLETSYEAELKCALDDDFTIEDWAANNMDWEDIKAHATRIKQEREMNVDFQEGWVNGEKEVVKY